MKDFKYCVWASPDKNHEWYKYTKGFEPHLSIKTNTNIEDAINIVNKLENEQIHVTLCNNLIYEIEDGFRSLFCYIFTDNNHKLIPKDAHVSFMYSYRDILDREIEEIEKSIEIKTAVLTRFRIFKCTGHFKDWKEVNKQ